MMKNVLDTNLTGKVAVVTGAGGVLCSQMARVLARAGAKVALINRSVEAINQYAAEFEVDLSKYTEAEYAAFVAKREKELFEYYDEAYFRETTYYEIVLDTLLTYPVVTTLDGRQSSLPQTK